MVTDIHLGTKADHNIAAEMLTESDPQVRDVLENALRILERRPRQVKRFLNLFRLTTLLTIRQKGPLTKEDFERLAKWVSL